MEKNYNNDQFNKQKANSQPIKIIDNYSLYKIIGQGSFGTVYECKDTNTGEILAVKCINIFQLKSLNLIDYLKNEISILTTLKHPNIIKLHEVKQTKEHIYLIMELCRGLTLTEYLLEFTKNKRTVPSLIARKIIKQIASAMMYYNELGIVHRDLKSDNIIINFNNQEDLDNKNILTLNIEVKIIDFGIAKIKFSESDMLKTIVGSALNMDPRLLYALEGNYQRNSHKKEFTYDFEVDVWSFGVICYFILFNNLMPFPASNNSELIEKYENGDYIIYSYCYLECFDFISRILLYDTDYRADIKTICDHPFLNENYILKNRIDLRKLPQDCFYNRNNKMIRMNIHDNNIRKKILEYLFNNRN